MTRGSKHQTVGWSLFHSIFIKIDYQDITHANPP